MPRIILVSLFCALALFITAPPSYSAGEPLEKHQLEAIVLNAQEGQIVYTKTINSYNGLYYIFGVRKDNNGIVGFKVNALTGKIEDQKIVKLGDNEKMPSPKINKTKAKKVAVEYIKETLDPVTAIARKITYRLYDGKPAYEVRVHAGMKEQVVYVNAMTGEMMLDGDLGEDIQ